MEFKGMENTLGPGGHYSSNREAYSLNIYYPAQKKTKPNIPQNRMAQSFIEA